MEEEEEAERGPLLDIGEPECCSRVIDERVGALLIVLRLTCCLGGWSACPVEGMDSGRHWSGLWSSEFTGRRDDV